MALNAESDVTDEPASERQLPSVRELYSSNITMVLITTTFGVAAATGAFHVVQQMTGDAFTALAASALALPLPILAWTDMETLRLPNKIVGPTALLCAAVLLTGVAVGSLSWAEVGMGLAVGLGLGFLMLVIAVVSAGLGMGDVKFVALAGSVLAVIDPMIAMTSTMILPPFLAVIGLIPVVLRFALVQGRNPGSATKIGQFKFAYGPYLVLGSLVGLLFGPQILNFIS